MKIIALAALFSLTGCVQWWTVSSNDPSPTQTPPTVTIADSGQVFRITPVQPPAAASTPPDNDAPGQEPVGGDGDGPTAAPSVSVVLTPEPTIAPVPASSAQADATPSPSNSPVAYVTPGPGPASSPSTTCASLGQVNVTSFGRFVCPYSALFTGNSPLHHRFATLMSAGLLTLQPAQIASNYWNTGSGNNGSAGGSGPLYLVTQSTQTVSGQINCADGGNGCGKDMYLPTGFAVQAWTTDYHVSSIDLMHNQEIDNWEASNWPHVASSGYFPLSGGTGIPPGGHSQWGGIAGGQALGAIEATAQELQAYRLASTHIGHALAFMSPCLSGAGVWPDLGQPTDSACSTQSAVYGSLIHLKSSYWVASDPNAQADPNCAALLWAFQEYGGYASDTTGGQGGIRIFLEGEQSSSQAQSLQSDSTLITKGCFNAVPSSAIEVATFSNDPTLPPDYGYGSPKN